MHNESDKTEEKTITVAKQTKRQQAEAILIEIYDFRFNVITGAIEWSKKHKDNYRELDTYKLNSLCRELDVKAGLTIGSELLSSYLMSDFTNQYHPITDYFLNLKPENGTQAIQSLAATIETDNDETFIIAFERWLVATVANAIEIDGCQNQTCLVLTGTQGLFKTKWLNLMCPPSLTRYLYSGRIDLQSKDTYTLLATKFIINLDDQLKELNKRDAETVKTLISHGSITIRRPYDQLFSHYPRLGSFCGSINGNEFLSDPTGSRRFLPFEAVSIDLEKAAEIDKDKVWSEAYTLYNSKYKYWFSAEDTKQLFGGNPKYQVQTLEQETLTKYYAPIDREKAILFMTCTEILLDLQRKTGLTIREKQMGEALKIENFKKFGKRYGDQIRYVYPVQELVSFNSANTEQ